MAHIGFYFTDNKNKTIELPIVPAGFVIPSEMETHSETVLKNGEVNIIGQRKLYEMTIEATLPTVTKNSNLTTAKRLLKKADDYIQFFKKWHESGKPGRLVVTGMNVNVPVTLDAFEHGMDDGNSAEYLISLNIKEFRDYRAKKLTKVKQPPRRPAPKRVGIGSTVIVNGRLHRDSYGTGPGLTERNAVRKVNFIAPGRSHPYHVTLLNGGWRGWVKSHEVRAI